MDYQEQETLVEPKLVEYMRQLKALTGCMSIRAVRAGLRRSGRSPKSAYYWCQGGMGNGSARKGNGTPETSWTRPRACSPQ